MSEPTQQNLTPTIAELLHKSLSANTFDLSRELLSQMHPSEIADVLEGLPGKTREILWNLIDPEAEGDVLSELQDAVRAELLENMQPQEVAEATKNLDAGRVVS